MLLARQVYRYAGLALVAASLGCDPGLHYRPRDWRQAADYRWSYSAGDIDLETRGTGGLIGSTGLAPEFTVRNRTGLRLQVVGATLQTAQGSFEANPIRAGSEEGFVVEQGEMKRITVSFSFSEPIPKILVDPVILTLHLLLGGDTRDVAIAMRKG